MSNEARARILGAISDSVTGEDSASSYAAIQRGYIHQGALSPEGTVALLMERLREYDAEVVKTTSADLAVTISEQLAASSRRIFAAPAGLPAGWMTQGYEWRIDHGLSHEEIEGCDGVVTAGFCAIADSGTIVLHHSAAEGRRALSLLPDWHLCVLKTSQVVETMPEYFARCAELPRLATYIAGPSATADIEMTRIKGVHGPRFLHVVLVADN